MSATIQVARVIGAAVAAAFLTVTSVSDIRTRKVPNRVVLVCGVCGLGVSLTTGALQTLLASYVTSVLVALTMGLVLYRTGTIGGGDVKLLIVIAVTSPGTVAGMTVGADAVIEAALIVLVETLLMLAVGAIWWKASKIVTKQDRTPPLVPMLLISFLVVQGMAFLQVL